MYVCSDRKLLFLAFVAKTAHVSHNLQCVCIYRVDMKEVELHLTDDTAEFRQVCPKNPPSTHAPELGKQMVVTAQQPQEEISVIAILSEIVINQIDMLASLPDGRRSKPLN